MSAREFLEWQVYDAVEGLPARRAEWGTALLTATLANVHRKKGAKPFRPDDFLMRDPAPAKPARRAPGNLSGFFAALDTLADRKKR